MKNKSRIQLAMSCRDRTYHLAKLAQQEGNKQEHQKLLNEGREWEAKILMMIMCDCEITSSSTGQDQRKICPPNPDATPSVAKNPDREFQYWIQIQAPNGGFIDYVGLPTKEQAQAVEGFSDMAQSSPEDSFRLVLKEITVIASAPTITSPATKETHE